MAEPANSSQHRRTFYADPRAEMGKYRHSNAGHAHARIDLRTAIRWRLGQTPFLDSDAYATGQVLYTLHEIGVPATDPAVQRGTAFLLRTQNEDGSWHVKSRAMKIQPYFESGFPYGHDQWISQTATAWAVIGLCLTAPEFEQWAVKLNPMTAHAVAVWEIHWSWP